MIHVYRRESGVVTVEIQTVAGPKKAWEYLTVSAARELAREITELCDQMEKAEEHGPPEPEGFEGYAEQ